MKSKFLLILTVVISSILFIISASAESWIDDYTYSKDDENKTVTLTKYNGTSKNVVVDNKVALDSVNYDIILSGSVFKDNSAIESINIKDGVIGATSLNFIFNNVKNLKELNIGAMDLSNTKTMNYAFSRISNVKKLDLSKLDTSKVESMLGLFILDDFDELNLSGKFNTSSVTNMSNLFDQTHIKKIIIGKDTNFHTGEMDSAKGGSFGRGSWLKVEDGKLYSTLEICQGQVLGKDVSGTYIKQSNISDELVPDYTVTYSINTLKDMEIISSSDSSSYKLSDDKRRLFLKLNFTDSVTSNDTNVTVAFKDAVTDANGQKYDLHLTINNYKFNDFVRLNDAEPQVLYLQLLSTTSDTPYVSNSFYESIEKCIENEVSNRYKVNNGSSAISYDIEMNIYDKSGNKVEGTFMFSAYDIDIESSQDSSTGGYGLYSEGINLISGYDKNTFSVAKSMSFLNYNPDSGRVTGTRKDNLSEFTEFLVKAQNGFKFAWTGGADATTQIIGFYQPKNVLIENRNTKNDYISGSKFEIYNAAGIKVGEWTTVEDAKSLFLNPGRYVVKQQSVPNPYVLAVDTTFYVDIDNKLTYNGEDVEKIVIINAYPNDEYKCSYELKDGVMHYYDTKGNEIDKSEWANKCQDPVPTGSFFPIYFLVLGISFIVISFIVVRKFTVIKKI